MLPCKEICALVFRLISFLPTAQIVYPSLPLINLISGGIFTKSKTINLIKCLAYALNFKMMSHFVLTPTNTNISFLFY